MTYSVTNQWPGGFQGDVLVTNTGTAPINGWTLNWTFADGQVISQLWNANYTQSGGTVTASNVSYNATIAPNTSAEFGFLASWNGANNKPTSFTLNGAGCAAG